MLHGVRDIHLVARDARFSKSFVEHFTGRSDERMSLPVFHASAHQEYDWALFFFLLSLLNAATALVSSKK